MADIQAQFEQFHKAIRVDFDMSEELRDKRDIVVNRIKKHLAENKHPGVRELLQGSYKMKTGVKPLGDVEYDIDIGLRFYLDADDSTDASTIRGWVYEAVKDHTKRCEDNGPCIRVVYEAGYHLDLVTYRVASTYDTDVYKLAHKKNGWRDAAPEALLEHVKKAREPYANTEDGATKTDQFRRVVRCLRRWDDVQQPGQGNHKPTGLAFVLLCCERLQPRTFIDGRPDDRAALDDLCQSVATTPGRLRANKPTPEYEDMFARLSDVEMMELKARFGTLQKALAEAAASADPVLACQVLVPHFGQDFPVPAPEDSGKRTKGPAIITSSVSA